jgi:uncharacterized protein YndB with AHSA1/START domain
MTRKRGEQNMSSEIQPLVAKAHMLIRRPVAEVFDALVDPAVTRRFWFSQSSGRLEAGKQVRWDWQMYGVSTTVTVKAIELNERILIEWNGPDDPSLVEWTFEARDKDLTFVMIKNWGFRGDANTVVAAALDSTGGFHFVVAGLKALLEHGIELNLVRDFNPDALVKGWVAGRRD